MTERTQNFFGRGLVALPLLSLFLGAVAWLRYGIDMPWFDDWRGYADGTIGSLDPRYLFRPLNDTMAPLGFALDALAQRFLDGNSVAYQFLSMVTVLGALLLLQWKLLLRTLENRFLASLCFAFTLFMLQPDSYWGRENLAYHQCLPLVFILWAVWIMVCTERGRWWHGPALLVLGLLSGFTYISGAFGAFTAGATLLLVAKVCYRGEPGRRLFRNALWFTAAGAAAAVLQYSLAVWPMRGTHAGIPMSLPHEAQFWAFFLGKLGRSLLLEQLKPEHALVLTLLVCAAAVSLAVVLARRAARPSGSDQDRRLAAIYMTIAAVVFVYMMLVAAGRTRFRPPEMVQLLDIFSYAFTRFHFFWATLLWPWLVAAALLLVAPRREVRLAQALVGAAFVLVLAVVGFKSTAFLHMTHNSRLALEREPVARCLLTALQREGPVECVGLIPPRFNVVAPDAYGAYAHAWNTGASFVRNFPLLPGAERADRIPPLYQLRRYIGKISIEQMEYVGDYLLNVTGDDSKLFVDTGQPEIMASCLDLGVEVDIRAEIGGPAKLYWLTNEGTGFAESRTQEAQVHGGGELQTLRFRVKSSEGFSSPIRLDPATRPQELSIPDFRVYCYQRENRREGAGRRG